MAEDDRVTGEVDDLFAVRPEEFVAARNVLVKRLKAAGERERAAEVATWRRPTPIDWALNQVARDDADAIGRFVDAAAAARQAQAAALSGRGEDLRAAVAAVRESSATVAALAATGLAGQGRPTASARAAVSTRLAEIAAEPSLASQLADGRLGAGAIESESPFDLEDAEGGGAVREPDRKPSGRSVKAAPRSTAPKAARPSAAAAKRQRDQARAVAKAERVMASAQAALAGADESLTRAEAERATARSQLERAERAWEKAASEQARRRAAVDAAAAALEQARQA